MQIQALVVEEKDAEFEQQAIELGEPARGEALVRIVASGVCHTDESTLAGDMPMPFPAVLGQRGVRRRRAGRQRGDAGRVRRPGRHRLALVRRVPQLP
jgi:aryl-alcohol dehydrogenase